MPKPFRFGVQNGGTPSAAEFKERVRRIEALGYSSFYVPDHFVDTAMAPMIAMAIAASVTDTLNVGALVFDNDYKHPAILAKELATIDVLSDGRTEMGIGAGWQQIDYDALGLPYDSPGVRIARLEEALHVIKGAWGNEMFSFSGDHYTITAYNGRPKPVQDPHPPILIGGGGPKVLRLAGREADIVGINPNLGAGRITRHTAKTSTAEETERKLGWIREGAGDRFDQIELQIRYFASAVTDERDAVAERIATTTDMTPTEVLRSGMVLVGSVPEIVETLQERRERWGVNYVVVGDELIDKFAPVVAALAGT